MNRTPYILLLLTLTAGCATTASDLETLKTDVHHLESDASGAERAVKAGQRYKNRLDGKSGAYLALGKAGLLSVINKFTPYTFKGRYIHSKLSGTFTLSRPAKFKLLPNNQAILRLELRGKGVKVNFSGYGKHKKKLREALAAGILLTLKIRARIDRKRNTLNVYQDVVDVQLRRHNKSSYRNQLQAQLNAKFFKRGHRIPLPSALRGKKAWLLTTSNQLVIGYD